MFIQRSQRHLFSLRSDGEIYWIQQHLVYLYLMYSSIKSGAAHPGIKVVCLYCHESVAEGRQHRRRSLCQALKLQVLRCQERPLGVLHFLLFPFPTTRGVVIPRPLQSCSAELEVFSGVMVWLGCRVWFTEFFPYFCDTGMSTNKRYSLAERCRARLLNQESN